MNKTIGLIFGIVLILGTGYAIYQYQFLLMAVFVFIVGGLCLFLLLFGIMFIVIFLDERKGELDKRKEKTKEKDETKEIKESVFKKEKKRIRKKKKKLTITKADNITNADNTTNKTNEAEVINQDEKTREATIQEQEQA